MNIICLFFPGFISLLIDIKINKNEKFEYLMVIKYFVYNYIINLLLNSVIYIMSSEKYNFYSLERFNFDFSFKFMWLAIIIACILPFVFKIFKENIKLDIKVKEKSKNEKSNK